MQMNAYVSMFCSGACKCPAFHIPVHTRHTNNQQPVQRYLLPASRGASKAPVETHVCAEQTHKVSMFAIPQRPCKVSAGDSNEYTSHIYHICAGLCCPSASISEAVIARPRRLSTCETKKWSRRNRKGNTSLDGTPP